MSITLNPGKVRVLSLRLLHTYRGVWLAELALDPTADLQPTGKVTIAIDLPTPVNLVGTVDPRGSGAFAGLSHVRVLGGGAGWDKLVPPQHYHQDGGIPNQHVYQATARVVGETVNVLAPAKLGDDFVRTLGPAARVFGDLPWWVDISGITQVGPRPTAIADPTLTLIFWDAANQTATLTCDTLVYPGTSISDKRLPGGAVVVRDVEQLFDAEGSHIKARCGTEEVSQLVNDLKHMVREFAGLKTLTTYVYRIVEQDSDGRLQLQSVHKPAGMPDCISIQPWTGHAGASAKYTPGTLVHLGFVDADPEPQPRAISYEPGQVPIESTVDATLAMHVGPSSQMVDLAAGTTPLVLVPWAAAVATAIEKFAAAMALACPAMTPLAPLAACASALATDVGALPPPGTTKVTGI